MSKLIFSALTTLVAMALMLSPAALAGGSQDDRAVLKNGRCSASSTWKLKAKFDDGRIEVEFEVDQNRVGRRWRVTLVRNGATVVSVIRRTVAPSGSFEVRRLVRPSGNNRIVARARALATGETCRGVVTV